MFSPLSLVSEIARFLGSAMGIAIANRENRCDFGALSSEASLFKEVADKDIRDSSQRKEGALRISRTHCPYLKPARGSNLLILFKVRGGVIFRIARYNPPSPIKR